MVRLGVTGKAGMHDSMVGFNSSMVRLGEASVSTGNFKDNMFQFQYGSIGRSAWYDDTAVHNDVSIPVWFDWE